MKARLGPRERQSDRKSSPSRQKAQKTKVRGESEALGCGNALAALPRKKEKGEEVAMK